MLGPYGALSSASFAIPPASSAAYVSLDEIARRGGNDTSLEESFCALFCVGMEDDVTPVCTFLSQQGVQTRAQIRNVLRMQTRAAVMERGAALDLTLLALLEKAVIAANRTCEEDSHLLHDPQVTGSSILQPMPDCGVQHAVDGRSASARSLLEASSSGTSAEEAVPLLTPATKHLAMTTLRAGFSQGAQICILWGAGKCTRS